MNCIIDDMRATDWEVVRFIYEQGIAKGNATFESAAPDWEPWDASHLPDCRLVARLDDAVVGWVALSPVSGRCVYRGVAEVSLYVAAEHRGQGIGSALLRAVIEKSEEAGIWTLQARMFPENEGSLRLCRRHGFREVGRRERLGKMTYGPFAGRWRDVVLMERRSTVVGN
jgi:phosphinothricin acetyltransferase